MLEAALRARSDFHSALEQLEEWLKDVEASLVELDEITMNTQMLKDSVKRKKWIEDEKVKVHTVCEEILVELNIPLIILVFLIYRKNFKGEKNMSVKKRLPV